MGGLLAVSPWRGLLTCGFTAAIATPPVSRLLAFAARLGLSRR
jgi:hypothetical protein